LFKRIIEVIKVILIVDYFSTFLLLKCFSFSLLVQKIVYFLSRQFQTSRHENKLPSSTQRSHKEFDDIYNCEHRRERYLPDLDKVKFLVPQELTLSQLANILRNRLHLTPSQVSALTP
jgi:hypothetical protein